MLQPSEESHRATIAVRIAQVAGWYAIFVGLIVLAGHLTGASFLPTPSGIWMKFNTSLGTFACGASVLLLSSQAPGLRRRAGIVLASFAALLGLLTFLEHVTGLDFHIDQLLHSEAPGAIATSSPGRMGPPASLSLMFIGLALATLDRPARRPYSSAGLALTVSAISLLSITGYAFGVDQLFGVARYTGIALITATVLLGLSVGVLGIRPYRAPVFTLIRSDAGGVLMRRTLPVIIALPLVLGLLRLKLQNVVTMQAGFGTASLVVSLIVLLTAFLWWAASRLGVSERRRTAAFDVALDCIITMDARGQVVEWNAAAERTFGYSTQEAVGKPVADLIVPAALREAHWQGLRRCVESGGAFGPVLGRRTELTALRKDGSEFPVELAISATRLSGGHSEPNLLFTAYARDITTQQKAQAEVAMRVDQIQELNSRLLDANTALGNERSLLETTIAARTRELEESYQRLRLAERTAILGTLTAGLGHDMANLLLPIRARLDVLHSSGLPHESKKDLEAIRAATEYLQRLANSLRMMTHDPDDSESRAAATNLAAWWPDAEPILRASLGRGISLQSALPPDLPRVRIDRHRLTQAIFNLVVNAADAMRPRGSGVVQVWAELGEPDRSTIRLGVSDDGPGMSEEVRQRCLEPYFSTKPRKLGTGMGLALVRAIVERAGGRIDAQSSPGQGATFTLELPTTGEQRQQGSRRARVQLKDPRARAYATTLLRSLEVEVVEDKDADILVIDACDESLHAARAFVANGHTLRRVVWFGAASELQGLIATGEQPSPASIRAALSKAAADVLSPLP